MKPLLQKFREWLISRKSKDVIDRNATERSRLSVLIDQLKDQEEPNNVAPDR